MLYTNNGLVEHAKYALNQKTKYMWGGIFRPITLEYINFLKSIYGTKAGTGYTSARYKELERLANKGYFGIDCVGLIKSYYWSGNKYGGSGSKYYGKAGYPDVNANAMYNAATVKGSIGTIPEIGGLIVYCKTNPHVGVYVGNGKVIESTLSNRGDGVVLTDIEDFKWEKWFECPYITYTAELLDIETIAKQVIAGQWGVGTARKQRLTLAGYDYEKVQRRVNEILRGK